MTTTAAKADDGVRLPGIRALASARFRLLLAILLASFGVLAQVVLWTLALGYSGQDASDFNAYRDASLRMLDGLSPYLPAALAGPFDAITWGNYIYPPLLAQALAPVARLPESVGSALWYGLQSASMYAAVWIGTGLGGARRSLERALWCLVAVLLYTPVFTALWYANTSALVALGSTLVATGGVLAGASVAVMFLVKLSPAAYVPAVLMMGRRARMTLAGGLLGTLAFSFLAAPESWFEFPTVLANLLAGSTADEINLAPANLVARAGLPAVVVSGTRLLVITLAGLALVGSAWVARKPGGYPEAALLGSIAMLLAPGSLWSHYLVVLLPFAAIAWPRAGAGARLGLLASAGLTTVAITFEPLAFVGAAGMTAITLPILWPRDSTARSAPEPSSVALTRPVGTGAG